MGRKENFNYLGFMLSLPMLSCSIAIRATHKLITSALLFFSSILGSHLRSTSLGSVLGMFSFNSFWIAPRKRGWGSVSSV